MVSSANSAGFLNFTNANGAATTRSGGVSITLEDVSSGIWTCCGVLSDGSAARSYLTSGTKTLSGTLDRVRITTVNGTDTFDAGSINILYE